MNVRIVVAIIAAVGVVWAILNGGWDVFLLALIPAIALAGLWAWWHERRKVAATR